MTNNYEIMMLFSTAKDEEATTALVERFTKLLGDNGTITDTNDWGTRKLAYPINDEPQARYMLFQHECEPEFVAELERIVSITDGAMRLLVIRKD